MMTNICEENDCSMKSLLLRSNKRFRFFFKGFTLNVNSNLLKFKLTIFFRSF